MKLIKNHNATKMPLFFLLIINTIIKLINSKSIDYDRDNGLIDKLKLYGYLEPIEKSNDKFSLIEISNAIKLYESFYYSSFTQSNPSFKFKINNRPIISKLLDDGNKARCSIPDIINREETVKLLSSKTSRHSNRKLTSSNVRKEILFRFQIVSKWHKKILKWSLNQTSLPINLNFNKTKYALDRAFSMWSFYSNLVFIYTNGTNERADILIEFNTPKEHNAICEFKFTNASYAHAFYPTKGKAHFQMDKLWSLNDNKNDTNSNYFNLISVGKKILRISILTFTISFL
jgi:hypothetical protein